MTLGSHDRRVAQIMLAAAFVSALELVWTIAAGVTIGPAALLLIVGAALLQAMAAIAIVSALGAFFKSVGRGRLSIPVLFVIASAPLAVWAGRSLFSGRFIRQVSGAPIYEAAFVAVLLVAVWVGASVFQSVTVREGAMSRRLVAVACTVVGVALSYVDTHVLVDLYPAFHTLLWIGLLYCACFAADLLVPSGLKLSARARGLALVALGATLPALVIAWNTPAAVYLATYSDGTYPKLRELMTAAIPEQRSQPIAERRRGDDELSQPALRFAPTGDAELSRIRSQVRNVVFVLIDSFRADYVTRTVDGASLTPHLDTLRKSSIYFETAYAPSALTERSMPSLMTSFGVPVVSEVSKQGVHLQTWIDALRADGYRTFANGICQHTNRVELHLQLSHCFGAETIGTTGYSSTHGTLTEEVNRFIEEHPSAPFAVYTHWMELHTQNPQRYVKEVRAADSRIGDLVRSLEETGNWDNTLLVITSDHGAGLGTLGSGGNVCCPETQMRVPVLIRVPGSRFNGQSVDALVSTTEIPGAILDVLGGRDKMALASPGLVARLYDPDGLQAPHDEHVFAVLRERSTLRHGTNKGVLDSKRDTLVLYDVVRDPEEKAPLLDAGSMQAMRDQFARAHLKAQEQVLGLLREGNTGIALDVLAGTVGDDFDAEAISALSAGFWERNSATRRHLLQEIVERPVMSLDSLDPLVRDEFDEDDQLLLIVRVYAKGPGACEDLAKRFGALTPTARLWLAQVIPDLSDDCFASLRDLLEAQLVAPSGHSPEARRSSDIANALTINAMVRRMGRGSSPRLLALLAEAYHTAVRSNIELETLRGESFSARILLNAYWIALDPTNPAPLFGLDASQATAHFAARYCARHRSELCPDLLKHFIEGAPSSSQLTGMFAILRRSGNSDLLNEAEAAFHARFPDRPVP